MPSNKTLDSNLDRDEQSSQKQTAQENQKENQKKFLESLEAMTLFINATSGKRKIIGKAAR